jgi:glutamine cyclotransferase
MASTTLTSNSPITGSTIVTESPDGLVDPGQSSQTQPSTDDDVPVDDQPEADGVVETLVAKIVSSAPHDRTAFTQGLELADGILIEGTGLYGSSTRRIIAPTSGDTLASKPLDPGLFGTGLTISDGTLVQLTWREGIAILADPDTLEELDRFTYEGEGWGICRVGDELAMSDGSSELAFRDPMSFRPIRTVSVTLAGAPLDLLNELECVDGFVWANVWLTNTIAKIDPETGDVVATVDASNLAPENVGIEDVLNGIAHRAETNTFYLTGKRWDTIYEVSFTSN